jgi:hypothetical protein
LAETRNEAVAEAEAVSNNRWNSSIVEFDSNQIKNI